MADLEKILTEKQIKPTAMRILILDFLLVQSSAQSLTDMELNMDHTDRVTLYRTIRTFEENGLVHRIEDGSGVTKFAICSPECSVAGHHDLHVHFYCTVCQETHCLPKISVPEVSLPSFYIAKETQLIIKGICGNCRT
ncbi:MAG: transcriptional repressor [Pedobacter sp.]|nr:MAG: transcriptional repressor [Pedobacter sp.]